MKSGDFAVELVRADTKEAFKEHTGPAPDFRVYAEVEPDVDYFIRVSSSRGGAGVGVKAKVDGERLGYRKDLYSFGASSASSYIGIYEVKDSMAKTTALHFTGARIKQEGGAPNLTGKVEVAFYKLGQKTERCVRDRAPKELTNKPKSGGKKCVVSTNGKHVLKKKSKASHSKYQKGELLSTMTLHYCTAAGLVVNKILDPPPDPANHVTPPRTPGARARVKAENGAATRNPREEIDESKGAVHSSERKSKAFEEEDAGKKSAGDEDERGTWRKALPDKKKSRERGSAGGKNSDASREVMIVDGRKYDASREVTIVDLTGEDGAN